MEQRVFKGLIVDLDKVDMPPDYTPDCCNVDLSERGRLMSIPGIEKQITTGLAAKIMSIHQLNDNNFVTAGAYLYKL